jgi:hypothetical protein
MGSIAQMTKQEFITKQRALVQNANRRLGWWLPVFFGLNLVTIPLTRFVGRHEERSWAGPVGIPRWELAVFGLVR